MIGLLPVARKKCQLSCGVSQMETTKVSLKLLCCIMTMYAFFQLWILLFVDPNN